MEATIPASWTYRCHGIRAGRYPTGDTGSRQACFPLPVAPHPSRPWAGRSPVQLAIDTARAAALLETATAGELNFTQQQVLTPRRNQNEYGLADALSARNDPEDRERLCGACQYRMLCGPRRRASAATRTRNPRTASRSCVTGSKTPCTPRMAYRPLLSTHKANGVSMREGFRQILHGLLKPLGALVVSRNSKRS